MSRSGRRPRRGGAPWRPDRLRRAATGLCSARHGTAPRRRDGSRARPVGRARGRALAGDRPGLRPADGARPAAVPDRPATRGGDSGSTRSSARSSTTRRCSSTSAATPTPTSRPSGSATTSPRSRSSTTTSRRSLRMAATGMRFLGSGHPPLHRFRLGLEFVLSGHREVDGMIDHHAAIARSLGGAARAARTRCSRRSPAAYERWDGRGWPGDLEGEEVPIASRVAQVAEFVEVANRIGGVDAARAARARAARRALRPGARRPRGRRGGRDPLGPRRGRRRWDAVIEAEPALAVVLDGERFDAALAGDRELRRPEVAVLPGPRARRRRARRRGRRASRALEPDVRTLRRAGLVHDLRPARGSRTRSWTSADRSAPASGSASACSRT